MLSDSHGTAAADGPPRLGAIDRASGRARTSDRVFQELVTAIRNLRLAPGCSLSEVDLAEELHVSRTPLREAIARLVDAGLVQVIPQVGTRVCLISLRDVEEARFVREALEVSAFEKACSMRPRDMAQMRRILDLQREACAAGDVEGFFRADEALHAQVFILGGYPGAWQVVQRAKLQLDRMRRLSLPDVTTWNTLLDDHAAIVDALDKGHVAVGRRRVRTHARRVIELAPSLRGKHPHYFTD